MNKELIFKKIKNPSLEKESITIENNKVILILNRQELEKILNHISIPLRREELKKWREENDIIEFTKSHLYEEYCLELLTKLKSNLDIAVWKKEITKEESNFFFSCIKYRIDEEIFGIICSIF